MTSGLLLILEALVLLILGLDLGHGFTTLPTLPRLVLGFLAISGALMLATPSMRRRFAPASWSPIATLAAAATLLAALGTIQLERARHVSRTWEAGATRRLEERARLVREDFAGFLEELVRPLAGAPPADAPPEAAFQAVARALDRSRLPRTRFGVTLHRADGTLLAWGGNSEDAPADLVRRAGPDPTYRISADETSSRIHVALRRPDSSLIWVAEFTLKPPELGPRLAQEETALDFLPGWSLAKPAHVHLREEGDNADDLSRFFERQRDRYWGRLGRDGVLTLSVPLRAPSGGNLAVLSLRDVRAEREIARSRGLLRRTGALLTATALLLAWLLFERERGLRPGGRFLTGTIGLWSARTTLLAIGSAAELPTLSIFDQSLYASPMLAGLMRSPADLLLTAFAFLGQALLMRRWLMSFPAPADAPRRALLRRGTLIGAALLAAGGGLALHEFLDRMVLDARLDLSRVELGAEALPRLMIQAAIFLIASSLTILVVALLEVRARCREQPAFAPLEWLQSAAMQRVPFVLRAAAGVFLLTLLYLPFLHHAYDHLRQTFFEDELLPRVVDQEERRARILRDSAGLAEEDEFAAAAGFAAEERRPGSGGVAYRLWVTTPMAEMGLASSLRIYTPGGRLLDRFAVNLAPSLEPSFEAAAAAAGGDLVAVPPRPRAIVRKAVLMVSRTLRPSRRPPLLVVMTVVDDYDNLPLVGADTGYVQMFRPRSLPRTNPELLRFDPMIAVFGQHLERLYESGGEIPPPGPVVMRSLDQHGAAWATDIAGEGEVRVLYARAQGVIFALAHPHASVAETAASTLRLFILNGLIAGLLVLIAGSYARGRRPEGEPASGTFYGRLTAAVLLTALVPLLILAFFVTRFSAREFARDLTTTGLGSLQVARRVAEDYLAVGSPEEMPVLDDDVVFWISRVVRQDLSVFRGADLIATSTRELYGSGLLNTRLDGEIYRALYLDREPFRQAPSPTPGAADLTLSAPMRVDREGTLGAISIPLTGQSRSIARKVDEVEDAVLISTCLTVLLLAGVGYLVARRVSEPITLLARAARRVAAGDLDVRVAAAARDEIAILVEAFNRMAASLREQREDLKRRKDYIEKILRSATTGVVSIDAAGSIITINPAAERLLAGPSGTPRTGENLLDRLALELSLAPLRNALARAVQGHAEGEAEVLLTKERAELRLRAVFIPFAPEEGATSGTIVLLEDVTEIVRSGRLAAWAEMARRIAHEIKNPLTPIQLSVEHIGRLWRAGDARFGEVLAECLGNIERQVRTLRQIASEFSSYARLPALKPEPTPIDSVLEDALGPYLASPPPGVEIARDLPPETLWILADRPILARAFVNLIENALQAMPDGGRLAVAVSSEPGGPGGASRVRIEVRDSGRGIDPLIMPRLFEPYFSTRDGGTGLGLAIVRRTVEEHGGTIEVTSRPGSGTSVFLTLPAATPGTARGNA